MPVIQHSPEIEDINVVIKKVISVVGDDEHFTVMAALLTMVVMATYPWLEGDELIKAVEDISKLLVTTNLVRQQPDEDGEFGEVESIGSTLIH